ncbi:MAG: hypothetical protein KGO05_01035 [Chloroflexota bacterium]|nr:hypothetical protein [Chloroflexota bacterium]
MADRFDKFTERARRVLTLAQEEAQRFNHNYIGTEHLLLGLVREGDGVAAKVLQELGVELDKVRSAVEFIIGRGDRLVLGEVGMTPRAKRVIELGVDEARRLNHHYIGTEHILLGLVREGEGIAAGVLESLGANLEKVRTTTLQVLSQPAFQPARRLPGRPWRPTIASNDLGKFSERARAVIAAMLTEARARGQRDAGTGHALLALLAERDGTAVWMLAQTRIDLDAARQALERDLGPRTQTPAPDPVGLDAHALRMIALAALEAQDLDQRFVGPEHLLLGIIAEGEGLGGQVLLEVAADVDLMRQLSLMRPPKDVVETRSGPALNRLTLLCRDVEATARFYMDQLGAASIAPEPVARKYNLRLPGGGPILALREGRPDQPLQTGVVLDVWVREIDLAWRTLSDAGIAELSPIDETPEGRSFIVPDPDGRLARIFQAEEPTAQ